MKTRRDILKLAAAAPAAAVLPAVAVAAPTTDPVIALLAEHDRLLALGNAASASSQAISDAYIQEPDFPDWQARHDWVDQHRELLDSRDADADYIAFGEEADALFDEAGDILSEIAETEPTTIAGAMAKLREAVRQIHMGHSFDELDLDHKLVVTVLADLERLGER